MPPDVVDNARKAKPRSDFSYTQHFSTRKSALYKWSHCYNAHNLSEIVQCFCLNHTEHNQKVQAKLTQILLAAHSGRFTNEYVFSHESSIPPPSHSLKDSFHCGKKIETLDSIAPAVLAHAVRTATVFDCAVLIQIFRPGSALTISQVYSKETVEHEGGLHSKQTILAA